MKAKHKKELSFVKEMPESEEIDLSKARTVSKDEFDNLLKNSGKKNKSKHSLKEK